MGKSGEGWVALQIVFFGLIVLSPKVESLALPIWLRVIGALAILGDAFLAVSEL